MAVQQHARQRRRFDAPRHQDRQVDARRVGVHMTGEAQLFQLRHQLVVQVGVLAGGLAGLLAFGLVGDAAGQFGLQGAVVIGLGGVEDGLFADHCGLGVAAQAQSYYAYAHATIR